MADEPMTPRLRNPFDDPKVAASYDLWYETEAALLISSSVVC